MKECTPGMIIAVVVILVGSYDSSCCSELLHAKGNPVEACEHIPSVATQKKG